MPLATKPKVKSVTVVQVVRPLTQRQKNCARLADLIELGVRKHPNWTQARNTEFRVGNEAIDPVYALSKADKITRACAMGFAMAGSDWNLRDEVFEDMGLRNEVVAMNDIRKKSLTEIVNYLRAEASTH